VDGSGIKVGVISDSFNTGGYDEHGNPDNKQTNIASDDLPNNTRILTLDGVKQDYIAGTDEGRGMAQLVHDLAPGSAIEFATAYGGQAGFANNIVGLAEDGAQVIVDDVFYYAEPQFQDGIIAQAVDQVVRQNGVTYFSSAGNQGVNGWEGEFNIDAGDKTIGNDPSSLEVVREKFMEFAPGQDYLELNLQYYDTITLSWDQPSVAAGNPGGTTGDLDFYLTNQDGSIIYRSSEAKNIGDVPLEILDVTPAAGQPVLHGGPIYLRVGYYSGDMPEHVKIIDFNNDLQTTEYMQNDGTTFGHSAAEEAISVAAARYADTPEYGTDPAEAEYFSSKGPVNIWLTADGTHLDTPEVRHHPQITAVDGGNTTFFGSDDDDADSHPNFYGTSAAAPDAAAVAALMLSANGELTKEDVLNLLEASASDMDDDSTEGFDTGYDARTGAGLINADLAVGFASGKTIKNGDQYILDGTHLDDKIQGSGKANELNGGDGNDVLRGNYGNDSLLGGHGTDRLFGGGGDDQLATNGDGDYLDGGPGADTYIFTGLNQLKAGTIGTLSQADTIDFSLIDADSETEGHQGLTHVTAFSASGQAEFRLEYNPNTDKTAIKIDLDGNGYADHNITIANGDLHLFDNFIV
jgi:subtilisin family serine protease